MTIQPSPLQQFTSLTLRQELYPIAAAGQILFGVNSVLSRSSPGTQSLHQECRVQVYVRLNPTHISLLSLYMQDREPVFPTRQSLGAMKGKLKGAETGHSLLKRKSEALTKYVLPTLLIRGY